MENYTNSTIKGEFLKADCCSKKRSGSPLMRSAVKKGAEDKLYIKAAMLMRHTIWQYSIEIYTFQYENPESVEEVVGVSLLDIFRVLKIAQTTGQRLCESYLKQHGSQAFLKYDGPNGKPSAFCLVQHLSLFLSVAMRGMEKNDLLIGS